MRYKNCHRSLAAIFFLGISLTVCASLRAQGFLQIENFENKTGIADYVVLKEQNVLLTVKDTDTSSSVLKPITGEGASPENIDVITPEEEKTVSLSLLLGTDLLLPGGGHFMRGLTDIVK